MAKKPTNENFLRALGRARGAASRARNAQIAGEEESERRYVGRLARRVKGEVDKRRADHREYPPEEKGKTWKYESPLTNPIGAFITGNRRKQHINNHAEVEGDQIDEKIDGRTHAGRGMKLKKQHLGAVRDTLKNYHKLGKLDYKNQKDRAERIKVSGEMATDLKRREELKDQRVKNIRNYLKKRSGRASPAPAPKKAEMSHEARELVLHGDNTEHLYRSSHQPIVANLQKKHKKGTYDHEKAKKLWGYHADRAAQSYAKEHGTKDHPWHQMFSKEHRRQAAEHWADEHRPDHTNESAQIDEISSHYINRALHRYDKKTNKILHKATDILRRKSTRYDASWEAEQRTLKAYPLRIKADMKAEQEKEARKLKKEDVQIDEAKRRLLKTYTNGNRSSKVYSNPDWEEHVVELHVDGKHQKKADYHTNDKADAHSTAQHMIKESTVKLVEQYLTEGRAESEKIVNAFMAKKKAKGKRTHTDGEAMYLHGNKIAWHDKESGHVHATLAGWPTSTTRERLNTLSHKVGGKGFGQSKWKQRYGDQEIDAHDVINLHTHQKVAKKTNETVELDEKLDGRRIASRAKNDRALEKRSQSRSTGATNRRYLRNFDGPSTKHERGGFKSHTTRNSNVASAARTRRKGRIERYLKKRADRPIPLKHAIGEGWMWGKKPKKGIGQVVKDTGDSISKITNAVEKLPDTMAGLDKEINRLTDEMKAAKKKGGKIVVTKRKPE